MHGFFAELWALGFLALGSNHMFHGITTEGIVLHQAPTWKVR